MNKTKTNILKGTALAVSWLTLSPLLFILDGEWKLLPIWLRIVLFVLSPLVLIVLAMLVLWGYVSYPEYHMKHHFVKRRVVENITGVKFPKYKVLNQGEEWECFSRSLEHTYDFTLEFKKMPDEDFYEKLDEHFDCLEVGKYSYSAIWGNGIEAPKGESDDDDISFSVDIERGSKTFQIRVGRW